ncbi:hypothetical protein NHF46_05825 [Arthrobacter alpinus]|nr:hypothetical protein [Arthrobacter alpinus]
MAAQTAVVTALDAKKEQSATLTAQLATLNNTSAAKEAQYRQGQDALAAYNEAQEAKRRAAEVARLAEAKRQAEEQAAAQEQAQQQKPALPNPAPNPANPNPAPAPVPEPVTPPAQPAPGGGFIPVEVLLPNIPGGAVNDPAGARAYASSQMAANGWARGEFQCLNQLWDRESSWLTNATNPSSGAYGIAQSLPPGKYASAGSDWLTNYRTQTIGVWATSRTDTDRRAVRGTTHRAWAGTSPHALPKLVPRFGSLGRVGPIGNLAFAGAISREPGERGPGPNSLPPTGPFSLSMTVGLKLDG